MLPTAILRAMYLAALSQDIERNEFIIFTIFNSYYLFSIQRPGICCVDMGAAFDRGLTPSIALCFISLTPPATRFLDGSGAGIPIAE
jgi:hypothetical protein